MNDHTKTEDPDIKPMQIIGGIIVGGIIGFLICHFMSKDEAAEQGITESGGGQAAIYQSYEAPDSLV